MPSLMLLLAHQLRPRHNPTPSLNRPQDALGLGSPFKSSNLFLSAMKSIDICWCFFTYSLFTFGGAEYISNPKDLYRIYEVNISQRSYIAIKKVTQRVTFFIILVLGNFACIFALLYKEHTENKRYYVKYKCYIQYCLIACGVNHIAVELNLCTKL